MTKEHVADVLESVATLLELKGENSFKVRAYSNAARAIENLTDTIEELVRNNRLGEVPGIGQALQAKIAELVSTGKLAYYEELKASTPPGLLAMLEIPGLGPKKIQLIYGKLKIETVDDLEAACKAGKLAGLPGMGAKTQAKICEGIERRRTYASQFLLRQVWALADQMTDFVRQHPDVSRCSVAGSFRRSCEVVRDVDIVASSKHPAEVIASFAGAPGVTKVLGKGETKCSVLHESGVQLDLRVVSDKEYAAALLHFTGSKDHNVVMRQRAIQRGLRLNEYGLFRSEVETRDLSLLVACEDEAGIFRELGLHYIPPEMRENRGEFEAAEAGPIPRLVEWTDLKGSLHNHSTWSDGHMPPAEIAEKMEGLGLAYWAITDHSKASFQANGLDAARLREQLREIRELNQELADEGYSFRLLSGAEVDILRDGTLDFEDDLLQELDVVVASIHQAFNLSEAENTRRLISAASNRYVTMLAHPTGRLLLKREGYAIDHKAVIDACAETGTLIELNSNPKRLDMDWRWWPYAKAKGVKCVINCDAHRLEEAAFLRFGAGVARKAGLTREDVVNTLPLSKLREALARKRQG